MRLRFIAFIIFSCAVLFGLDRLIYDHLIFLPTNHSGWDSFRWYNFEYNFKKLKQWRQNNPHKRLVIVSGSSIAKYSVHTKAIEDLLYLKGIKDVVVRNFMHAAMTPADLYFYSDRLDQLKPDLVVYPLNPADLDLERYSQPWQNAVDYEDQLAFDFMSVRHPGRLLYPGPFADEFMFQNGLDDYLQRKLYASFDSLKRKEQWFDPIRFHLDTRDGFVKSYLVYQGVAVPEGLWKEGRSISCFSLSAKQLKNERDHLFHFEIPPGIFQNPLGDKPLVIRFYEIDHAPNSGFNHSYFWDWKKQERPASMADWQSQMQKYISRKGPVCNPANAQLLFEYKPKSFGWKKLDLQKINPNDKALLVVLSHVEALDGTRIATNNQTTLGKGIRLPAFFGRDRRNLPTNDLYIRRSDWDSRRIYLLNTDDARSDFYERNEPDDWISRDDLRQLNFLRMSKYYTNWYDFEPQKMIQARYLKKWVKSRPDHTKVLLVNNPENPATLDTYEWSQGGMQKSEWYRSYQSYLNKICLTCKCQLIDEHRKLPENYFLDAHHLNWEGMLEMAPVYANQIARILGPSQEDAR